MRSRTTTSQSSAAAAVVVTAAATTTLLLATAAVVWQQRRRKQSLHNNNNSNSPPSQPERIYLDYNGTTPVLPSVVTAMMPYLQQHYGNPSSTHWAGREPCRAVQRARRQILQYLLQVEEAPSSSSSSGLVSDEPEWSLSSIWFTSCGTESDNLAIHLALQSLHVVSNDDDDEYANIVPHIITSNVEHPAISNCLQRLEIERKVQVTYVPVQPDGRVRAADMIAAIQQHHDPHNKQKKSVVALVTLMLANNESGAIQPVRTVAAYCRQHGILFHTDAAQAAGKVRIDINADLGGADLVTIVGHKLGAPKGIACLYVRPGCLEPSAASPYRRLPQYYNSNNNCGIMLIGGGQEHGRRAGTENVPYIVGCGQAAELAGRHVTQHARHMEQLRSRMWHDLVTGLGQDRVRDNGPSHPTDRLPNTLSVGIKDVHAGELLAAVGDVVAASAGAACHNSSQAVSSVLMAMQVSLPWARGTVRLSVGPHTTLAQIDQAAAILVAAVHEQLARNRIKYCVEEAGKRIYTHKS